MIRRRWGAAVAVRRVRAVRVRPAVRPVRWSFVLLGELRNRAGGWRSCDGRRLARFHARSIFVELVESRGQAPLVDIGARGAEVDVKFVDNLSGMGFEDVHAVRHRDRFLDVVCDGTDGFSCGSCRFEELALQCDLEGIVE